MAARTTFKFSEPLDTANQCFIETGVTIMKKTRAALYSLIIAVLLLAACVPAATTTPTTTTVRHMRPNRYALALHLSVLAATQ